MYCVMRASVPSLHNVYRRYDNPGWERVRGDDVREKSFSIFELSVHQDGDIHWVCQLEPSQHKGHFNFSVVHASFEANDKIYQVRSVYGTVICSGEYDVDFKIMSGSLKPTYTLTPPTSSDTSRVSLSIPITATVETQEFNLRLKLMVIF